MQLLLRKEGADLHRSSEFEIVREIKESKCFISTAPGKEDATAETERVYLLFLLTLLSSFVQIDYRLPDNVVLKLGPCRYRAPEILFRPEVAGEEWPGVHACLRNAIQVY